MDGMSPSPWEWILIAGIVPAVLEASIISVGVYLAVRFGLKKTASRSGSSGPEGESAPEIVRRRYAKGEISRREYEQLREDLGPENLGSGIQKEKERAR